MTRKVGKDQERLWSADTVSLGRAPEAKSEGVEPTKQHRTISTYQKRQRARALVGCAAVLALALAAIAIFGGSISQHTARQPAPSEIMRAHQHTEPRISVRALRATRRRRRHSRHRIAKKPRGHRKHNSVPASEAELVTTMPPVESVEIPEASTALPASSPPELTSPTSPSKEFGIERNGD